MHRLSASKLDASWLRCARTIYHGIPTATDCPGMSDAETPTKTVGAKMVLYDDGTVAVSVDLKTLAFTPAANLPSQHVICAWNGNGDYLNVEVGQYNVLMCGNGNGDGDETADRTLCAGLDQLVHLGRNHGFYRTQQSVQRHSKYTK